MSSFICKSGILIGLVLATFVAKPQLVINEVCPRNATTLVDENGDFDDWIEIFNNSQDTINLLNWKLSDNLNNPDKWVFPEAILLPGEFLLVFADANSNKLLVDHWETAVHADSIWRYWIPDQNPDSLWNTIAFNDSSWMEGPGGFGRGDGDDNTILPDSIATVYIRKKFTITDTAVISRIVLHVDFDDAFVAYLNGTEIARKNIGWPGKIEDWDNIAYDRHFAQMYQGLPPDEFRISRDEFLNLVVEGENVLAVQGLNAWNNDGNSSLIPFLSFGLSDTSNQFYPLPGWFETQQVYLHTNFKLSADGEELILTNHMGEVVDQFAYPPMQSDNTYGRVPDGSTQKGYIATCTPGASNNSAELFQGYCKTPVFEQPAGFYDDPFTLSISNQLPGDTIRYTLDGSWVTDTSQIYNEPLFIDSTVAIRAQVFRSGFLPGKTTTATYFFNESLTLPVISLNMNPHDLWDEEEGIYVLGNEYEPDFPFFGANFWQDWEKPVNIEYFDTSNQKCFELEADVVIHGGYSRAYDMKSLRVLTNGKYDQGSIDYKIFPDKDISSFRKIILRNAGQDYNRAHLRDALAHRVVASGTNIDYQAYQPAVMFLNGKYWGIHNIREKIDRFFVQENFGINPDSVQLLRDNIIVVEGNFHHYAQMIDYIKHVPTLTDQVYDSIARLIDIPNYTDYFISEIHFVNPDWPNHNTKYWRLDNDTSRWRYILTDVDFGFGLYSIPSQNELNRVLHQNIQWADNHKILRRLLENDQYKKYFINRSADLFNTVLETERVVGLAEETITTIEPEIERHLNKWNGSLGYWQSETEDVLNFIMNRLAHNVVHYISEFDLVKAVEVAISIDSVSKGKVNINTISPEPYPWSGSYFDGNPITLKAEANPGYVFSHWETGGFIQNNDSLMNPLEINVDTNAWFKAHFNSILPPLLPNLIISEINFKSADTLDTGDWIELMNIDTMAHNLSGWMFRDGNENHSFLIPDSIILDTNAFIVLCEDTTQFKFFNPNVEVAPASFGFGLASEGEELFLFDSIGNTVISMTYQTIPPWPDDADGTGKTFEIVNPLGELNDGTNWFAGCVGGSPGGPYLACDTIDRVQSITIKNLWEVYPNPARERLFATCKNRSSGSVSWELHQLTGKVVLKGTMKQADRIEIITHHLLSGIYTLQIRDENHIEFHKVLLTR